ncbi:hypothetical protein J6590_103570 [Homalodisca vitripennis]|nr:hypothetical protein J6590_103570 [Homalodisca vitripennis]
MSSTPRGISYEKVIPLLLVTISMTRRRSWMGWVQKNKKKKKKMNSYERPRAANRLSL